MTEAEARARIEDLTQWQAAPALSEAEVDRLLARALTTDDAGYEPGDDGYTDTYTHASVNAAIGMGWEMKAAKVAGQYDVKAGDVEAKRSQQIAALTGRARAFNVRGGVGGIGTITLTTAIAEADA